MINNVFRFVFWRKNKHANGLKMRTGNVLLPIRKTEKFEINPKDFQRFALRFMDCHRKSQSSGELNPLELELNISRMQRDSSLHFSFIKFCRIRGCVCSAMYFCMFLLSLIITDILTTYYTTCTSSNVWSCSIRH